MGLAFAANAGGISFFYNAVCPVSDSSGHLSTVVERLFESNIGFPISPNDGVNLIHHRRCLAAVLILRLGWTCAAAS
jgi:hypothetical protein